MRAHGRTSFVAALAVCAGACLVSPPTRTHYPPAPTREGRSDEGKRGEGRSAEKVPAERTKEADGADRSAKQAHRAVEAVRERAFESLEKSARSKKANGEKKLAARSASPDEVQPPEAVLWNFWVVDDASAKLKETVAPGDVVRLQLDLSTVFFGQFPAPLRVSDAMVGSLQRARTLGLKKTSLNLVVVPDATSFVEKPFAATMDVDLVRLEELLARQRTGGLPASVDEVEETLEYSVGRRPLRLSVKGSAAKGAAPVVISVWDEDWSRPLDEITVVFDIGGAKPLLGGAHSLAFGALDGPTAGDQAPDAAIHFLAPDATHPVRAIFRKRGAAPDAFEHWELVVAGEPVTGERLTDQLTAIANTLGTANSGEVLEQQGRVLHDLLFPGSGAQALSDLLAGRTTPPALFVRTLDPARSGPLAAPLAFVRRSVTSRFLGDEVLLETPLELRATAVTVKCVSQWAILLPPAGSDTAMDLILREIGTTSTTRGLLPGWKRASVAPTDGIASFRSWVTEGSTADPTVLLIASHQSKDTFSFKQAPSPEERFDVGNFRRTFSSPSIAILAGCDTGGPDAARLIRRLNWQGFTSIIATSTPANGAVLGRFLSLFAEEVSDHPGDRLGPVFDRALQRLRADNSAGKALAPRALQLTLLGDRNVPICPPK